MVINLKSSLFGAGFHNHGEIMWLKKIVAVSMILLGVYSCSVQPLIVRPFQFSPDHMVGDKFMQVTLQGSLQLPSIKVGKDKLKIAGLSALAWDEDEDILYAVSDSAKLFHLRPIFKGNELVDVKFLEAYWLRNPTGKRYSYHDTEGLAIRHGNNGVKGDSELVISFERQPRIVSFTPLGIQKGMAYLPEELRIISHYQNDNKMLEAVMLHPQFGTITTSEYPLRINNDREIVLYNLTGQRWTIPRYFAKNSAVVALEAMEDGSILILERAFVSPMEPVIISLRNVRLNTDGSTSKIRLVSVFDSSQGWAVDNFEGMSHHRKNFFFIISDNNDLSIQRTLLNYIEVQTHH